jgi:5'-methylthioadenosine phosphorylase
MKSLRTSVGIIGGSGLYELDALKSVKELDVMTPYGRPSDVLVQGTVGDLDVYFLPRHGRGHRLLPSELNARANIWALKKMGVTHIVSVSAVGSLREEFAPGDIVVPDSLIDRTSGLRPHTFFGNGVVGHVSLADPFCPDLRSRLLTHGRSVQTTGTGVHDKAVYICVEGPRFSTRAESHSFRQMGAGIIGMTAMPEASLAREAEIAYATLAFVTDYDCWRENEEAVSVDAVMTVLKKNVGTGKKLLEQLLVGMPKSTENPIFSAAENAIMTPLELIPHETRRALSPLYGKYWFPNADHT